MSTTSDDPGRVRYRAPAVVCAVLALLTGCAASGGDDPAAPSRSPHAAPREPGPGRAPVAGKGSKDPDDLNGDGYRDLVVPVAVSRDPERAAGDERVGVVFGSARGPDPATRAVYGRRALGLPVSAQVTGTPDDLTAGSVTTADLDGDGFPDLVSAVGEQTTDGGVTAVRQVPYVAWGSPTGPGTGGAKATPVRLGPSRPVLESMTRGDFDGDGHHDLAGLDGSTVRILYGPFDRSGTPARSGTLPGTTDGYLDADAIDPAGRTRVTALLVHEGNDGGQSAGTLYADPRRRTGRPVRKGNAVAFGDFDGDGRRDLAIGDDGGRNDEPGYETEAPDVDGSLSVYPGDGGSPATYELPEAPADRRTDYGPGGYVAADPDGDGRDGILVATYDGATLIDGDRRVPVLRQGPARVVGGRTPAKWRHARPYAAADFDADGKDELVLAWGAGTLFGLYGEHPTHWWITSGTSGRDATSFATTGFTP